MVAGAHGDEITFAREITLLARTRHEVAIGVEHEIFVMEDIHDHRQVCGGDEQCALAARAVEMAMGCVQRNGEEALRAPFERALGAIGKFNLRRTCAFEHIDDIFIEMVLRRG